LELPFFDETHLFWEQILYPVLADYLPGSFMFLIDSKMFDAMNSYSYLDADDEEDIDDFLDENENGTEMGSF